MSPTLDWLIHFAVQAPSARDLEPWAFVIFEGKQRLLVFSEEAKSMLLRSPEENRSPKMRHRRCCSRKRDSVAVARHSMMRDASRRERPVLVAV
jgi:nitroreductase